MSEAGSDSGSMSSEDRFKKNVREWVNIHDKQAELRKVINAHNKHKKQLAEEIVVFMRSQDKEILNLGAAGSLQVKSQKSTVALKQEHIEELLQKFLNDPTSAKEGAQFIVDNKQIKYKDTLKRRETPI